MSFDSITSNPAHLWGTPCIRDTGITVAYVVSLRRSGYDDRRILEACPRMSAADLEAALDWHGRFGDDALGPHLGPPGPDHQRIAIDPGVQGGHPVVLGTRITVDALCGMRDAGYQLDEILGEYPGLTAEDVTAAVAYDAEVKGR